MEGRVEEPLVDLKNRVAIGYKGFGQVGLLFLRAWGEEIRRARVIKVLRTTYFWDGWW
jgi:hypothetical protein